MNTLTRQVRIVVTAVLVDVTTANATFQTGEQPPYYINRFSRAAFASASASS